MLWFLPLMMAAGGGAAGAKHASDRGENPWSGALKGAALGAALGFGGAALTGAGGSASSVAGANAAAGTGAAGTAGAVGEGAVGAGTTASLGAGGAVAPAAGGQAFMGDLIKQGAIQGTLAGGKAMLTPQQQQTTYGTLPQFSQPQPMYWG